MCPPVAAELVIYFHCPYARKMAVEPLKLNQLFFPVFNCNPMFCNLCTRSSNRAIASAAVRANRRISSAKRRSSEDAMLSPSQNHMSRVSAFVSKLTFPTAIHCKTNAGSTHTYLVAPRRGLEKDCCCYVHLALLPTGWSKSTAKSKSDGQKRHESRNANHNGIPIHPVQKPLTYLDLQSTLEFPCPKPCPKMMLQSASVHPSADVFGNHVVLPADVLPAVLQCDPKS